MASACTVLVVEGEPMIRSYLATMLQDEGCETYEAGDAAEAFAIMEGNSEITVVLPTFRCRARWTASHLRDTCENAGRRPSSW